MLISIIVHNFKFSFLVTLFAFMEAAKSSCKSLQTSVLKTEGAANLYTYLIFMGCRLRRRSVGCGVAQYCVACGVALWVWRSSARCGIGQ